MPMMKSYGRERIVCALGNAIMFMPDTPTYVSPTLVQTMLEQGVELLDEPTVTEGYPAAAAAAAAAATTSIPNGDERLAALTNAVRQLMVNANPTDFTASGAPKVASVTAITGFPVQSNEITPVFHTVRAELAAANEAAANEAAAAAATSASAEG